MQFSKSKFRLESKKCKLTINHPSCFVLENNFKNFSFCDLNKKLLLEMMSFMCFSAFACACKCGQKIPSRHCMSDQKKSSLHHDRVSKETLAGFSQEVKSTYWKLRRIVKAYHIHWMRRFQILHSYANDTKLLHSVADKKFLDMFIVQYLHSSDVSNTVEFIWDQKNGKNFQSPAKIHWLFD